MTLLRASVSRWAEVSMLTMFALVAVAEAACPSGAVCADAAVVKAHVGAFYLGLDAGDDPNRTGWGVDLGYGSSILSKVRWKKPGFTIRDDFWLDLLLGLRTSEPLLRPYTTDEEGPFAWGMDTAYVALPGYQGETWGLFAGTGIRYHALIVAGSDNFNGSRPFAPLAVRGELYTGKLGWRLFAWTNTRFTRPGFRFDLPLANTAWISTTWLRTDAPVELTHDLSGPGGQGGHLFTVGLRVAAME